MPRSPYQAVRRGTATVLPKNLMVSCRQAVESLSSRGYKKILEGKIDRVSEFAYFDAGEMHCIIEPLHLSSELPLFLAEHGQSYP